MLYVCFIYLPRRVDKQQYLSCLFEKKKPKIQTINLVPIYILLLSHSKGDNLIFDFGQNLKIEFYLFWVTCWLAHFSLVQNVACLHSDIYFLVQMNFLFKKGIRTRERDKKNWNILARKTFIFNISKLENLKNFKKQKNLNYFTTTNRIFKLEIY